MTLDECRAIAKAVPDIVFAISACEHGMGMAMTGDIDIVERFAERLPVVEMPVADRKYVCIEYAYTRRGV